MSDECIGIDLGTSNSCVAYCATAKPEVVSNHVGDRTTPSVVTFAKTGKVVVGAAARRQAVMNPTRTITTVKRLIGRKHNSDVAQSLMKTLPYQVVPASNGDAWIQIEDKLISPQEVQAHILEELRVSSSAFIGKPVSGAVITVPSFFDEIQRQAVRDAAKIAGFSYSKILTEPTAAALAYGYAQLDRQKIVIVDFGGGTLDVTVMNVDQGKFTVLASDGDLVLGGHDFDRAIAEQWAQEIREQHKVNPLSDPVAMQRLMAEAEVAKKTLTTQQEVSISLPFLLQVDGKPVDFKKTFSFQEFEAATKGLVERMVQPCKRALEDAGLRASEMDDVILVGGMTRSPLIQDRITDLFERKPKSRVNPDEVVALGASLLAAGPEKRDDITFVDVAPRTLGIRTVGDNCSPLIPKSTQLPFSVTKGFATTENNQTRFEIEVLQGEESVASKNTRLASIVIEPITQKPAGEVKLKVTFSLDSEGGLQVSANEIGSTDAKTQARVEPQSGLPPSEIARLSAARAERRGEPVHMERQPKTAAKKSTPTQIKSAPKQEQAGAVASPSIKPSSPPPGGRTPAAPSARISNQGARVSSPNSPTSSRQQQSARMAPKLPKAPQRGSQKPVVKAVTTPQVRSKPPARTANSAVASGTPPPEPVLAKTPKTQVKKNPLTKPKSNAVAKYKAPLAGLAVAAILAAVWFFLS